MFPEVPYKVYYNGVAPWGTGYTDGVPFVSVDVEDVYNAGLAGQVRTVTLNGTIPSGGVSMISTIKDTFINNFKSFSAPNISMDTALVQEINFGAQNYFGKVDYSIVLKDWTGFAAGVSNPIDEVAYSQEADGSVTINHKLSAVGVNPNIATALNDAKLFVLGRTGINGTISLVNTSYISNINKSNLFLVSIQEGINRAASSYAVSEIYKYDPLRNTSNGVFKRFSLDFNSGIGEDYAQVAVNGAYSVGKDVWNTGLFAQVAATELFTLASSVYSTLNSSPLSFSVEAEEITDSLYARIINIKAVYDSNPQDAYFDYDCDASKDLRNGITQVNIKGSIMGSGRHVRRRFDSALSFYNNEMGGWDNVKGYLYRAAMSGAQDFSYTNFAYNPRPKSVSVVFNSGQGNISLSASFDDSAFVSGFSEFSYGVNCECGLNVFRPHSSANKNGSYVIQDLDILNRTSVSLNGSFVIPATGSASLGSDSVSSHILPLLMGIEGQKNAFVESESYNMSIGEAIKTGFNYNYTKDGNSLSALPINGKIFKGLMV